LSATRFSSLSPTACSVTGVWCRLCAAQGGELQLPNISFSTVDRAAYRPRGELGSQISIKPVEEFVKILHPSLLADLSERTCSDLVVIGNGYCPRLGGVVFWRLPTENVVIATYPSYIKRTTVHQHLPDVFARIRPACHLLRKVEYFAVWLGFARNISFGIDPSLMKFRVSGLVALTMISTEGLIEVLKRSVPTFSLTYDAGLGVLSDPPAVVFCEGDRWVDSGTHVSQLGYSTYKNLGVNVIQMIDLLIGGVK